MALLPGICTQCGATLSVDSGKECMICTYCGTPFIIEKAINKFQNTYNISNSVIHIHNGMEVEDFEKLCETAYEHEKVKSFDSARKLWEDIVDKFPNRYEGWLGLIGNSDLSENMHKKKPVYLIYESLISTVVLTKELREKVVKRLNFLLSSRHEDISKKSWDFLKEQFPELLDTGHKEAVNLIRTVNSKYMDILAENLSVENKDLIKLDIRSNLVKCRKKLKLPEVEFYRRINVSINEENKLPCVIGNNFYGNTIGNSISVFKKANLVVIIDTIIDIDKELDVREKNRQCIVCGAKLNIFGNCSKCRK